MAATIPQIQRIVAAHFSLQAHELTLRTNQRRICFPRQLAIYFIRVYTASSLKRIGMAFGNIDHSTVLYAARRISDLLESDKATMLAVSDLKAKILAANPNACCPNCGFRGNLEEFRNRLDGIAL